MPFDRARGAAMPKLTIENVGAFDVPEGKRLVLAIEDCGVDILHRCGGFAECTTCRIEYTAGEPAQMTRAEKERLEETGEMGRFRLSCQARVADGMAVRPLIRLGESGLPDSGPRPRDEITPDPEWVERPG
jgi:ferredoxin